MKRRKFLKKQKKKVDRNLFWLSFFLTLLGVVVVADASAPQALNYFSDEFYFAKQQVVFAAIGIIVMLILSKIKYTFWEKIATPFFITSIVLLILVLIPGLSTRTLGAKRWLSLGPVPRFQPSEIVKFSLVVYFAKLASSKKGTLSYFIPLGLVSLLIMLQPDLGTTMVIAAIGMSQILMAGVNFGHIILGVFGGGVLTFLLIILSSYRRQRLLTFIQGTTDPLGKSYHIRQILMALGSGGFFGVGLGQSRQKYLFLPEAATDSVFAVVAEEVGFLGATVVIILLFLFIKKSLKVVEKAPDDFSKVLSAGIVAWIGFQIFFNIGSMISLVPLTGLPLPFISYGGSSLITVLAGVGILLNISSHARA